MKGSRETDCLCTFLHCAFFFEIVVNDLEVSSVIYEMASCVCILYFGTYQSQLILLYGTCVHVGDADDTAAYVWALIKLCLILVVRVE
jgi:hypothetical protein